MTKEQKRLLDRIRSGKPIYGTKKSKKFGRLNAEERVELYTELGIFDIADTRKASKAIQADLRAALKSRDKQLGEKAKSYTSYTSTDLYQRYAEQEIEFNEREDEERRKTPEKFGLESPPDYPQYREVATNNDKWTILRRLAQIDGRLNVDRAYASQTLHEIEDMVDNNENGLSISEITELMSIKLELIEQKVEKWNAALQDFADEDDELLISNKGFHGIAKARAHDEATKRGKTRNRTDKGVWISEEDYKILQELKKGSTAF